MPDWLRRRLEAAGLMDPGTGATRRARAAYCQRCRKPVMRGLDADTMAMAIDCDPAPLSAMGEVLALLAGRRTFELRWIGDRYELDRRDHWRIRSRPAATQVGCDVLVLHDCELSELLPAGPTMLGDQASEPTPIEPPY